MGRLIVVCCALALLGPAAATAGDGKIGHQGSTLTKHGLAQFDADGNGMLDASERAAALAARRAGNAQSSVLAARRAANDVAVVPGYIAPSRYPYTGVGPYPHFGPQASYTHMAGGLAITPATGPQTAWAFCGKSQQWQSATTSVAPTGSGMAVG